MNRKNSKLEAAMERKNSRNNEEQERKESQPFRFSFRIGFENPCKLIFRHVAKYDGMLIIGD